MWSPGEGALYWIDWLERRLFRFDLAAAEFTHWETPQIPGSLALRAAGGLVVALAHGFFLFDPSTGAFDLIGDPDSDQPDTALNDGKCDRKGRFWAGTMHDENRDPKGALFRLDADHSIHRMVPGITMSNGIAWSPDDRVLYFADSRLCSIFACEFDLDAGAVGSPRVFAETSGPGVPDGSTVDSEGYLWSAQFNEWKVVRYDPRGRVDRIVELPVSQPTSCMFGGPGLDQLYVTTARYEMDAAEVAAQPLAGALLVLDVGIRGLPEPGYAD